MTQEVQMLFSVVYEGQIQDFFKGGLADSLGLKNVAIGKLHQKYINKSLFGAKIC